MKNSGIEWTHHTFNPWHGCVKVSDGCKHCYAETLSHRWGNDFWGVDKARKSMSASYWHQPFKWNDEAKKNGTRARVFCASMADVFEDRRDLDHWRRKLWDMIEVTTSLDWLLLTKRPQNIARLIDQRWVETPRPNVWLGTTVENQEQADKRIPELLQVPAAVRFLSCEPLLEPVELTQVSNNYHLAEGQDWLNVLERYAWCTGPDNYYDVCSTREGIDWVIVGGESGHGARPMPVEWVRYIKDQCLKADVPFFMKQMGGAIDKRHDLDDLPEDLRIRQFPTAQLQPA